MAIFSCTVVTVLSSHLHTGGVSVRFYGMAEMIRRENREKASFYWKACIPDAATNQQLFDVVKKHLNDFPQSRETLNKSPTAWS